MRHRSWHLSDALSLIASGVLLLALVVLVGWCSTAAEDKRCTELYSLAHTAADSALVRRNVSYCP